MMLMPSATRAAGPEYDSGGTGPANSLLQDAFRAAYHGRYTKAIDYDNQALALLPNYGGALASRAGHYLEAGRYAEAERDLNRLLVMHPDAMWVAVTRADLSVRRGDGATALADIQAALKLPILSTWHVTAGGDSEVNGFTTHFEVTGHMESQVDEYGSIAEQMLHQDDAAVNDFAHMLKLEAQHPEYFLARYCDTAAVAGLLEEAEFACQSAIDHNSHDIGQYDSLGFVHLRMKQWDKAIADYNKALFGRPDLTLSLYGRGIAKRALGDMAGGNADIQAATANEPDIAKIMKRLGAPVV
jgi:tetratricopeptide (TPR) repeat protein